MLPVIALVGQPNVGKSTLFNGLTRSNDALVADLPGLTRDRQYGLGRRGPRPYVVVDTGGLTGDSEGLAGLVAEQVWSAIDEADAVLLLVDGSTGMTAGDQDIAGALRRSGKPVYLVVNKTESLDPDVASAEFHALGFDGIFAIAALHNQGINPLMETVLGDLPVPEEQGSSWGLEDAIRLAIVGRPNVGKSTLVNRLLGEQRMLTLDMPGTTRDSVAIPLRRDHQNYILIDTAGVRRRARVQEKVEKFSVIKALQAMEKAHVVVMMMDARQGIGEQDATLLGLILERGRALVLAVNKWDHLDSETRQQVRQDLQRKLHFLDFAKPHFISALHGSGVMDVMDAVDRAHAAANCQLSTPELTRILEEAMRRHQPPLVGGRSIKLRYAHQGGKNPPLIVIHGNRTEHVPAAYRRYLSNTYRRVLGLEGTPLRIEFKAGENPYVPAKPSSRRSLPARKS